MVTDLCNAVLENDIDRITALLRGGCDPNLQSPTGETPLGLAAGYDDLQTIELLLEAGADPNYKKTTTVPIIEAAGGGHIEVVQLLLSRGANIEMADEDGETAMHAAAASNHLPVLELLLRSGAKPDARSNTAGKRTPIIIAAERQNWDIVERLRSFATEEDLQHPLLTRVAGTRVSPRDLGQFMDAARSGDANAVIRCIESGVSVDIQTSTGLTALMNAANMGRHEIVELLLSRGADPNVQDHDGDTAIVFAANGGHLTVFKRLYQLSNKASRQRAEKAAEFNKKLASQYPEWGSL